MGVATTASLSILSSLAINYALDNMKDKREKHLREEIKERVFDTLRENTDRLRTLEYSVEKQVNSNSIINKACRKSDFRIGWLDYQF